MAQPLMAGDLVLLENCRVNKGEKKNNDALAQKMARALRRLRATTPSAPRIAPKRRRTASPSSRRSPAPARCWPPSSTRSAARSPNPKRPLVAIVAGSKVSTKLTILRALAAKVDPLIVGGGIANTFMLAAGGRSASRWPSPTWSAKRARSSKRFAGEGADPGRRRLREALRGRRARRRSKATGDVGRRRPDPRHRPADRRDARDDRSPRPARSSGTARSACSSSTRSRRAPRDRRARSPAHRRSRSPAAATRWRRSPSSASRTASRTSPPAAAPSWSSSKARRCRPSPRSNERFAAASR